MENQVKSSDAAITVSCRAVRWQVLPEEKDLLGALQTLRFDQVEGFPGLRLLKLGDSLFWGHLRVGEKDYFIKGRKQDRFRRIVKSLFRASKLREEWRKTWWLKSRGIETVEPVAIGEVRWMGALLESFLVTRWIPEARNLLEYMEEKEKLLSTRAFEGLRKCVVFFLGRLFGSLHVLGVFHRQFHDRNILVVEANDATPRLLPIDLDHLTIFKGFREEDRDWNFYQLAWHLRRPISRFKPGPKDVVQFLKGYHQAAPQSAADLKALVWRMKAVLPPEPLLERPKRN